MRGRTLSVPNLDGLRPTSSRVREALFNILGPIQGSTMLDLFAGSGVMALEALSRGASKVLSIDASFQACAAMRSIQKDWQVEGWDIRTGELPKSLQGLGHFDVIFADPPYHRGWATQIPQWLQAEGIVFGALVIEEASRENLVWQAPFFPTKSYKYGESMLHVFKRDA